MGTKPTLQKACAVVFPLPRLRWRDGENGCPLGQGCNPCHGTRRNGAGLVAFQPGELKDATRGGFLELVSEWEVAGGGIVDPHSHPTHEFYYIISGRGIMKIADEEREVGQGDLIRIPPDVVHSIWPLTANSGLRGLAFAVGIEGAGLVDYTS